MGFTTKNQDLEGIGILNPGEVILVGFRSEKVIFVESDISIKNPEQILCGDRDEFPVEFEKTGSGWKKTIPPDSIPD
jgi:hypothetical protein